MRRVEALDTRLSHNIDKTDSIISKLRNLDTKLFQITPKINGASAIKIVTTDTYNQDKVALNNNIDGKLVSLDQKVSDIDQKLAQLKNQLDSNFVASDDINAEASEKKFVNANVFDVSKAVTSELEAIKTTTNNIDRKLQFHMTSTAESIAKLDSMVSDLHDAIVEPLSIQQQMFRTNNGTLLYIFLPQFLLRVFELIY
jgi:uncharacterized protein (DUF342 family)